MRVTAAFSRLLHLPGIWVREVRLEAGAVSVHVALRRRRLACPECAFTTRFRYDRRAVDSRWRHLDLGVWRAVLVAELRRLRCPAHGVRTEAVPFARAGSRFSADFEDLAAWLATTMDKSALCRLLRIDWDTVGRIVSRVSEAKLDPHRLDGLRGIAADEVSWKKRHHYLTLVSDHGPRPRIVWGAPGRDAATLDRFFAELGPERSSQLEAVSIDMSAGYEKSVRREGHAPQATICFDPFHVVALGTKALDAVRRHSWNELRRLPDQKAARRFKGARWCLLKNPEDLDDEQARTLRKIRRQGGALWRAYALKEALRAIFAGDLEKDEVTLLLRRFCSRAQRSGLPSFVSLAQTLRRHAAGIEAAVRLGITNASHEGLNRRVRLIVNRAYGFHSAEATLALVMLALGPITHVLPHERLAAA